MLGNYLNMSILRERNYHSSNSSKQVGNSACFTGSAFPLGRLLAGDYRVCSSPSIPFTGGPAPPSQAGPLSNGLGCCNVSDHEGQPNPLASDALTPGKVCCGSEDTE